MPPALLCRWTAQHADYSTATQSTTAHLHGSDPAQGKRVPLLGAPKRHHSLQARDLYPSPGRPDTGEAVLLYMHSHVSDRGFTAIGLSPKDDAWAIA